MSEILRSTYTKAAIIALFIGTGVAIGIIGGFAFVQRQKDRHRLPSSSDGPKPPSWVKFAPGDAFPMEEYTNAEGERGEFELLLRDKESLVIFFDWHCATCVDLLRFVQSTVLVRLVDNSQVVLVTDHRSGDIPKEYAGLARGLVRVMVDGDYWRATYHTVFRPIIVGVDGSGIVLHVQFGYPEYLDREIAERFLKES